MELLYNHLAITEEGVYLLGYELVLTSNEKKILRRVAEATDVGGVTSEELLRLIMGLRKISLGNVAAHVSAINRKASLIGGRRLIVSCDKKYILNEFM